MRYAPLLALLALALPLDSLQRLAAAQAPTAYRSHSPVRPLPVPSDRPLGPGPACFVDAVKGSDHAKGTQQAPWQSIDYALKKLKPGDTLYLRGGTYYGCVTVAVRGTADRPITIRSYPGELVILDGGIREFYEDPANAWEPFPQGGEGEFRSTKAYSYGGGFGNFGDSMVPFHRYMTFADLRSTNELYRQELNNRAEDTTGIYAGPGARETPATPAARSCERSFNSYHFTAAANLSSRAKSCGPFRNAPSASSGISIVI